MVDILTNYCYSLVNVLVTFLRLSCNFSCEAAVIILSQSCSYSCDFSNYLYVVAVVFLVKLHKVWNGAYSKKKQIVLSSYIKITTFLLSYI